MAPFYKEFGDLKGKEKYGPWGKGVYIQSTQHIRNMINHVYISLIEV